jgi:hypothetical protein
VFKSAKATQAVDALEVIYAEEVAHVAYGSKWFLIRTTFIYVWTKVFTNQTHARHLTRTLIYGAFIFGMMRRWQDRLQFPDKMLN